MAYKIFDANEFPVYKYETTPKEFIKKLREIFINRLAEYRTLNHHEALDMFNEALFEILLED